MRWQLAHAVFACALLLPSLADGESARPNAAPLEISEQHLDANYWISRLDDAESVRMDAAAIADLNAALRQRDPSIHRLEAFDAAIPSADIRKRIASISTPLAVERFDATGSPIDAETRRTLLTSLALDMLEKPVMPRFGMVVRRAALRTYPTLMKVFSQPGDTDIDRFQESALFPGDAVIVLHQSADSDWYFVIAERYAAWIEASAVAIGKRDEVLRYAAVPLALTVIGKNAHTVTVPETNDTRSQLALDMGVRVPWLRSWPATRAVNGQLPLAHWVVELPQRSAGGSLEFRRALIARSEPMSAQPLAYTGANLLRQAFRFLGERYGWGHDFTGRDCSGFVSEVYRSMGIVLPRNTGDQARSAVFDTLDLTAATVSKRRRALSDANVGDLIHIPGHVMMVIGRIDGALWVIHDAHKLTMRNSDGTLQALAANGVVVTPFDPLVFANGRRFVEQVTYIQRIQPRAGT